MSKRKPYFSVNLQALDSLKSKTGSNWVSERHCIVVQLCFVMKTHRAFILRVHLMQPTLSRALSLPSSSPSLASFQPTTKLIDLFSTSKNLKNVKFYLHVSKKTSESTLTNRMVNSENFINKNQFTLREREGLGWFPMFGYIVQLGQHNKYRLVHKTLDNLGVSPSKMS